MYFSALNQCKHKSGESLRQINGNFQLRAARIFHREYVRSKRTQKLFWNDLMKIRALRERDKTNELRYEKWEKEKKSKKKRTTLFVYVSSFFR